MKKIIILSVAVILIGGFWYGNFLLSGFRGQSGPIYFAIESGQTLDKIATDLKKNNLIKNELAFVWYVKLTGKQSKILAGEHLLDKSFNTRQILNVLISSDNINNEKTITIIEGWRASEIADYLEDRGINKKDFISAIEIDKWRDDYDFLTGIKAETVEGFLFPDTYRIFSDAQAEDIVQKMLDNFDSKLTAKMRIDIINQGKNIFDVVNLASIIEREVPKDADKKLIADIFLKRLDAGIALQSDATVNYATGQGRAQPTYNDLKVDSPYNTYKYRGLPPGPISNPGIKSIEAAIYPTKNPYYYFLTTLDDGTVIYSKTYEEHLINKARYLN